ncbi:organic cation transporter protein-like isoform X1 [Pollicipes pollicipes]|uniref:organic cation transporter protein-like isoform X1 n=1 Tax=Pollicipes pollicipes TaxID=41117 RepID=UPI00188507CD|nr:organic cation transporter protein-like isoform X1 [Pollicipes pollicipes]XP_037093855.1 organic cation transporter protein-like isoform X1 [Pollicipes pollicipes]
MEVDAIYHEIDGWGRYQKLMYFMLCLPSIVAGAAVVSLSWTAYDMPYRCLVSGCENATSATYNAPFLNFTTPRQSDPANADYPWSECDTFQHSPPDLCEASAFDSSHQTTCSQYVYDKSVMHSTVVSEFQLSCGRDWLPTLANSLYMVGMFVGSLVIGHISDRFGRKTAMLLSFLVLGVASTATVFVKSFGVFAPLRFLTGVGGMGTFMTTFLLAVETVSNDVRTFCGFAIHFFFPLGESIVGVLAMYIKDWRDLQLFIALPVFIFLSYWLFVPESARWLAAEGRFKEAEAVLRTAAKYNGTEFPEHLVKSTDSSAGSVETPAVQPPSMSVLDLFRSPTLRWKTSIILYQWFVCAMVYYGLGLNATRLGSSVYVNFILVQIIEVPAAFCCILLLDPWGRKLILSLSFVLGGLGSIASGVVSGLEDAHGGPGDGRQIRRVGDVRDRVRVRRGVVPDGPSQQRHRHLVGCRPNRLHPCAVHCQSGTRFKKPGPTHVDFRRVVLDRGSCYSLPSRNFRTEIAGHHRGIRELRKGPDALPYSVVGPPKTSEVIRLSVTARDSQLASPRGTAQHS